LGSWSMMTSSYSSNAITFSICRRNPWTYGTGQQNRFAQPLACRRPDSSAPVAGGNRRASAAYRPVSTLPNIRPHVGCPPGVIL
jgi:hypothetical protein